MFRICVINLFLLLLSTSFLSCSLRGEDVLESIEKLQNIRDFTKFNKKYFRETKILREKYPNSLNAHIAYINARMNSKAVIAEYKAYEKERKSSMYQYLSLRAELGGVSYRDAAKRSEIIEKLETIVLANKENSKFYDDGLLDLHSMVKDKKKGREYAEYLFNKRPNYLPYKKALAEHLKVEEEKEKVLQFCEDGIKGMNFEVSICDSVVDINFEENKELKSRIEKIAITLSKKGMNTPYTPVLANLYRVLKRLSEKDSETFKKHYESFISGVLKKDPKWIPYPSYKNYYGDIDFSEFQMMKKIGDMNKVLDQKRKIADLIELSNNTLIKDSTKSNIFSTLGYAYLNPAVDNKMKAYEYLLKSYELDKDNSYLVRSIIDLVLELGKDPDIGLMMIDEALESSLRRNEKIQTIASNSADWLLMGIEGSLVSLFNYQGRLYLAKGKTTEAKLSFLKSYQLKENELAAFFLGKLYMEKNPMLALDFLSRSIKYASEESPLKEKWSAERDTLMKKVQKEYFTGKFNYEEITALYEDKGNDKKDELHPFIGKDIVTQEIADFKGGNFDWSKLKGKNVILSFWATWCTPCFQEMAVLNKIKKEGKINDLKIVAVCTDGLSEKKKVRKIVKEGNIDFEILLSDGSFRDKYFVTAIPSMFFLNKSGKYIKSKIGYSPELEKEIFKIFP